MIPTGDRREHVAIASVNPDNSHTITEHDRESHDMNIYQRQLLQYQHQISEADALLDDLRTRENDAKDILLVRDSQLAHVRARLVESESLLQTARMQLENRSVRTSNDLLDEQAEMYRALQTRFDQLDNELQIQINVNQRLNEDKHELETRQNEQHRQLNGEQQANKQMKSLLHQFEHDMNEYKAKAQRILQTKDQLITKLKDLIQHRSSTPTIIDSTGTMASSS
jgi:chromosome segregation ATPase